MEHLAELGEIVTGFNITEQYIDFICGKNWLKLTNALGTLFVNKQFLRKRVCQES